MKIFSSQPCLMILLLSTQALKCTELPSSINTYHGTAITRENILDLVPQPDSATVVALEAWLIEHEPLIAALTNLDVCGEPEARKERLAKLNELVASYNLTNISNYNFVLPFNILVNGVVKTYLLKIPGMPIVRSNYNAELEVLKDTARLEEAREQDPSIVIATPENRPCINLVDPFIDLSYEDREKICAAGKCPTVQSISRAAHKLLLQEWIENNPASRLLAPTCYLVHIPGRATEVSDQNYLLIEEAIEGIESVQERIIVLLNVLPEIREAARYVGLWSIHPAQFVVTHDEKVAIVDLEQPGNTPSDYFFHKNQEKFERNCKVGQNELDTLEKELKDQAVVEATRILCAIAQCNKAAGK